ncbi:hypothetical protein A2U01_0115633, partial [Trifolium medium]|nr:hypothetical protein [Trifolium medium]
TDKKTKWRKTGRLETCRSQQIGSKRNKNIGSPTPTEPRTDVIKAKSRDESNTLEKPIALSG